MYSYSIMMDINIIANSYITSISTLLKLQTNSTHLGCFQNVFNTDQQVDCFKSFILTQVLCTNFCNLRGKVIDISYFSTYVLTRKHHEPVH